MKKLFSILLAGVMMLSLAACSKKAAEPKADADTDVKVVNPMTDVATIDEAQKLLGFKVTAPETFEGFKRESICCFKDEAMLQLDYVNGDRELTVRKAPIADKSADISGDYNEYTKTESASINGNTITLRYSDELVCCAIWSDGGFDYSVTASDGMSADDVCSLIAQIH